MQRAKTTRGKVKERAEELFIRGNMSQSVIAEIVGVNPKTMSAWVNENNGAWKISKAAYSITKERVISGWYMQLYEMNQMIQKREEGKRFPGKVEGDTISKLASQIEKLERKHNIGTYIQAIDELMNFLHNRNEKLAAELALHTIEFVKYKAKNLNG